MNPDEDNPEPWADDEPLPRHYDDGPAFVLGLETPLDRLDADYAAADWAAWRTDGPA